MSAFKTSTTLPSHYLGRDTPFSDPHSSNNTPIFLYVDPLKVLPFLFFITLYLVFFLRLPGPGGPGGSPSGSSGELGGLGGFGCPGGFFSSLAPLRLKENTIFLNKFLEVTLAFAIFRRTSLQCSLEALEFSQFSKV